MDAECLEVVLTPVQLDVLIACIDAAESDGMHGHIIDKARRALGVFIEASSNG